MSITFRQQHMQGHRGFSLMELLVSLTLFTVVITMAVGTLLVLINANTKAQNLQEAMTNLTFALDSMSREIRTGRMYYCSTNPGQGNLSDTNTQDCTSLSTPGRFFSFIEGGESLTAGLPSNRIAYRYNSGQQSIERRIASGAWQRMTSEDVRITDMRFIVTGTTRWSVDSTNLHHPTVTMYIEGEAGNTELAGLETSFAIQTTVSMRATDI